MSLSSKEAVHRLVSFSLLAFFFLASASWTHLSSKGENHWISQARESRCIAYRSERLNLKSAVNTDDETPASDFPEQISASIAASLPIAPQRLQSDCRLAAELEISFLSQSPILNL